MDGRGRPRVFSNPADLLHSSESLTDIRYNTNHFGNRCMQVWKTTASGKPVKVAGATLAFVDFLLQRPGVELPKGLREMVEIRRNHAAKETAAA